MFTGVEKKTLAGPLVWLWLLPGTLSNEQKELTLEKQVRVCGYLTAFVGMRAQAYLCSLFIGLTVPPGSLEMGSRATPAVQA